MRRALVVSIACFAWAGTAAAEPPPGGYQENQPVQYYDPNAPPPAQQQPPVQQYDQNGQPIQYDQSGQPVQYDQSGQPIQYDQSGQPVQPYPQQQQPAPVEQTAEQGRGLQYGATVFAPMWLGKINDQIAPGIGIQGRVGWEVGSGLSLELGVGAMVNPDSGFYYDGSLTNIFVTGGVRYGFLNPSALVPFLQGGVQINLFRSCYEDAFGTIICPDYADDVTAGFTAGGGLIWEISQNAALEGGVNVTGTTAGTVLDLPAPDETEFWLYLSPFLGFTLYY